MMLVWLTILAISMILAYIYLYTYKTGAFTDSLRIGADLPGFGGRQGAGPLFVAAMSKV